MSRSTSKTQVSLFPFLAVLVCTMGALILLLLVTTRRIRQDVTASVLEETQPETVQVESQASLIVVAEPESAALVPPEVVEQAEPDDAAAEIIEAQKIAKAEHVARLEVLQDEVADLEVELRREQEQHRPLLGQVAAAQAQLDHVSDDETPEVTNELEELRRQAAILQSELAARTKMVSELKDELDRSSRKTEEIEAILKRRQSALVSLRKIVSQAETEPGSDSTILDFTNSTGTSRAPIVINVTSEGYEFLPMGVRLSNAEVQAFSPHDNPLITGVVSLHQYRYPNSVTVAPYVLLLVRPSGTMSFYAAQRSLDAAAIHFGYELLSEHRKIDAGDPQDEETLVLQSALQGAMKTGIRPPEIASTVVGPVNGPRRNDTMRVAPDGSIIFPGESDVPDVGRYFAGGTSLPPSMKDVASGYQQRHRPAGRRPSAPPASGDAGRPEADASSVIGAITSPQPAAVPSTRDPELPSPFAVFAGRDPDFSQGRGGVTFEEFELPELVETAPSSQAPTIDVQVEKDGMNVTTAAPVVAEDEAKPQDQLREAAGQNDAFPNDLFANAFEDLNQIKRDAVEAQTPTEIFGRPRAISGNLGVRGGEGFGVPPVPSAQVNDAQLADSARRNVQPNVTIDAPQRSDRTDSPRGFDWPDSAPADANQEPRTVESPGNPAGTSGGQSDGPANDIASGAASQSFLQNFMLQNGLPGRRELPSPMLKAMLSTAVANDPGTAGYHPMSIQITKRDITVFGQPRFSIEGSTLEDIVQRTRRALAAEVRRLPADVQEGLIPAIDYRVGPGAARVHRQLEAALQDLEIPTRTLMNVGDAPTGVPKTAPGQLAVPAVPQTTDPAMGRPVDSTTVPESRSAGRRLAI